MWRRPEAWRRRVLRVETLVYLPAARLALCLFPFRCLAWYFSLPARRPELSGDARLRARKEVRDALIRARRRSPGRITCLHQAMAAQAMLRRRGVNTTLYYGTATLPEGLTGHAWVQDGTEGVIGYQIAQRDRYHVLAHYPASPEPYYSTHPEEHP